MYMGSIIVYLNLSKQMIQTVNIVNKLDIVGLVEKIPVINGYKSFSVVREKESRGGIICYIRDVIAPSAVPVMIFAGYN
jgi:hypothetical protein